MKKILFTILFLICSLFINAQDLGGNRVSGVTPIKRTDTSLDATKILPPDGDPDPIPIDPNPSTGSSTEVGITEGSLSVSLTGGATYNVPIAVPPGINGVVPKISLTYNSQGGNGMAGYGWSLTGTSTISRIPSTKFHDGTIDAVDFNSLDRFAFDGQRLVLKNGGVYGANAVVYETESFSNLKITSYGVHPSGANYGPAYFIVEYPDGSIAQYGNNSTSRTLTDYAIDYWQNPQGVRISYNYIIENNVLRIDSINYGTTSTNTSINQIQFVYNDRTRSEQAFVGGQNFVNNKILKEIHIIGNGVGFRNYYLVHDVTSLGYQRLKSITEKCGDNSLSYNPTVFSYDTTTNSNLFSISPPITLNVSNVNFTNCNNITGDFDGDGKMDFLLYPTAGTDAKKKYWLYDNLQGTGTNIGFEHNIGAFDEIFPISWLGGSATLGYKLAPMQGWGIVQNNTTTNVTTFGNYSTVGSAASGSSIFSQGNKTYIFPKFNTQTEDVDYSGLNAIYLKKIPKKYVSGDFDGDGLTDVLTVEINSTFFINSNLLSGKTNSNNITDPGDGGGGYNVDYLGNTYLVNLDKRVTSNYVSIVGQVNANASSRLIVADVNGDGKSDLLVFNGGIVNVFTLNDVKQLVLLFTKADGGIFMDKPLLMGDYNGDGKFDFVIPQTDNTDSWRFYLSTGTDFNATTTAIGRVYETAYSGYFGVVGFDIQTYSVCESSYVANDFNGDGKTDILSMKNYTVEYLMTRNGPDYTNYGDPQVTKLALMENRSTNGGWVGFTIAQTNAQFGGIRRSALPVFLDHNSLNRNLEYALISGNFIRTFKSTKDNRTDVLLKKITTGNGVNELITYSSLTPPSEYQTNYDTSYTDSRYTENYPYTDIITAPTLQVVSQLEKQSASVYKKQQFMYYGAVSNIEGLGFMGFRATMRTNWFDDNGTSVISSISKSNISLRGANIENYSAFGLALPSDPTPTSGYISRSFNTYNMVNNTFVPPLLSNKVFKLINTNSSQYNGFDGTHSESETIYDVNNNPLTSTTTLFNGSAQEQKTIGVVGYDSSSLTPYVVGRPINKTQTITIYPSGDSISSDELYAYNNGLLSQVKKRVNNTPYITEDNIYDSYGNITKKTVSTPSIPIPRVTNYEYDLATHRFLIKSYDIENLMTEFDFNPSSGVLNWEKNPNLLQTKYFYDKWFKKIKTTDYLNNSKNYIYSRSNEKTVISETNTPDDGSGSKELFDDLGRKIKSGVKNINGDWTLVDYFYDIYDRNYIVSEPYFGDPTSNDPEGSQWNETQYDEYGRVSKTISFKGKTVTMTYVGLTTTINDGVKTKISVKNAIGQRVSLTDTPGGTINYTYFANGGLKTSNYGGIISSIQQDAWGRKWKLTDPSIGTYEYTYNDFGESLIEKTQKGITTNHIDAVGKVDWKTIVGINGDTTNSKTTYVYNSTTKLLDSSGYDDYTAGNHIDYAYTYDSSQRLIKATEKNTQTADFEHQTTYDSFGRPEKEFYSAKNNFDSKTSTKWVKNTYKNGYPYQIIDDATQQVLWQTNTVDERGQLLTAQYGYNNGDFIGAETHTYDTYGSLASASYKTTSGSYASTTPFMLLTTSFDPVRGNLLGRTNSMFNWTEDFTNSYDQLDRLTSYKDATGTYTSQTYDDKGRIITNNVGTYAYNIVNPSTGTPSPYQASSVTIPTADTATLAYYNSREQNIAYNAFKSPVWITEQGKENIDFQYNAFNSRSTMYYGDQQTDKLQRKYRKFYSADGSMEIKRNTITNAVEFITYIGGDGYTAPIILKSDGLIQNYLYLHRDYQGSILAITDANGQILEKRLFDAWGTLIKYGNVAGSTTVPTTSDGLLLDRGYTGHEHLLGVGLINMNARLYDPKLHRFLGADNYVQDPSNTQSYNRYAYCWNNPLKYADYNGEWFGWDDLVVAAASFVIGYVSSGIQTGNWGWNSVKSGLISAGTGWLAYNTAGASSGITAGSGVLNGPMWSFIATSAATSAISYFIPPMGIQMGDFSFSISPAIAFGNGSGIGANLSLTYSNGDFSFSGGIGIMSNSNYNGLGKSGMEIRQSILAGYDDGKTGFSLGKNFWSGTGGMKEFSQETGVLGIHSGDFRFTYENDGAPFNRIGTGDGSDRYRTAAASIGIGKFSAGFNLFTGSRTDYSGDNDKVGHGCVGNYNERMPNDLVNEFGPRYRMGAAYLAYGNYRFGVNSDRYVRHPIQDHFAHNWIGEKQPGFESLSNSITPYFQYQTRNIFTSW